MESQELVRKIFEVVPTVMHSIRMEMRSQAEPSLSVPQFRVLVHLSLGMSCNRDLAEHIGISVPAMSKKVDQLVRLGLVNREPSKSDGRQMELRLTAQGKKKFERLRGIVQGAFADKVERLSSQDRKALDAGLSVLQALFIAGNL